MAHAGRTLLEPHFAPTAGMRKGPQTGRTGADRQPETFEVTMIQRSAAIAALLAALTALGACQTARLGGVPPAGVPRPGPAYIAPEPVVEDIPPAPSGPVTSEPLAPLPGTAAPVVVAEAPAPSIPAPETAQPQRAAVTTGGRSAMVGGWTAREATGTTCRVQLSSSPALDLYKASAAGCANKDLARVTAWDYREGEVYLYQPGGAVAARLRTAGGSMEGALAKSGAPLTLAR